MIRRWVLCVCSQYSSLWSVSNSALAPVSQTGGINSCLGSQFFRGSSSHYPGLSHSVPAPPSGSPLYDSSSALEAQDAVAQYDGRLPSAWTPVTPPSLWGADLCKLRQTSEVQDTWSDGTRQAPNDLSPFKNLIQEVSVPRRSF